MENLRRCCKKFGGAHEELEFCRFQAAVTAGVWSMQWHSVKMRYARFLENGARHCPRCPMKKCLFSGQRSVSYLSKPVGPRIQYGKNADV